MSDFPSEEKKNILRYEQAKQWPLAWTRTSTHEKVLRKFGNSAQNGLANVSNSGESAQNGLANVGKSGESAQNGLANVGESGESRKYVSTGPKCT